ncbi:hypothetical protein UFOVP623_34 [uncultured Caudovirales phage]|uniref:Uncharacterized protein n=1 Tax=uncultured Caudovirales phage TaxID=2100421 RepID=A0A6J5N1D8_9CAUD|nr:hypothetical protein UFOVP623_34 [uncultured Caudovirales phage]
MANKIKLAGTTSNTFSVGLNGDGNITAAYYIGDGSQLTGITATATPAGSNTQVQYNDNGATGASANLTFNQTSSTLTVTNIVADGAGLTNIAGSNVSGNVGNALNAYSVAVANVVGIGNISTTNYNGNGTQVLAGNGAWIAQSGGGGGETDYTPTFLLGGM